MKRKRADPAKEPSAKALLSALDRLPVAFALFDAKRRLAAWNAPLTSLGLFPKSLVRKGTPLSKFERHAGQKRGAKAQEARLPDGKVLRISSKRVPPGHLLLTYDDVTQAAAARDEAVAAREQQKATAEILKVIAKSSTDVQPVFDAIVGSAAQLFDPWVAGITIVENEQLHWKATSAAHGVDLTMERTKAVYPLPLDPERSPSARAILGRKIIEIEDATAPDTPEFTRRAQKAGGFGAITFVPLTRGNKGIGTITLAHPRRGAKLTDKQLGLLQTFADQAVIAIENVRLFNETKEALERQTATSEVLKTISRSTFDLDAVLQVLIENATRLAGAHQGFIFRFDGEVARLAFSYNAPPEYRALISENPIRPGRGALVARVLSERRPVHIPDALADPEFKWKEAQRRGGFRSMFGVPMMREGNLIGVIAIWRTVVQPFTEKQIELVSTFADQAVIAIENVRLFNETKEALERQTATAEILNVIARSPADVQPVLDAVAENAARLCGATDALILSVEGGTLLRRAHFGPITSISPARPLTPDTPSGRAILERRTIHIEDILADLERGDYAEARALQQGTGFRTLLAVPLMREDNVIGVISIRRTEVRPFTDKQIELVKTFADQAVIAIENVRLFNETKESLERQTATAEILKVISSSPTDTQPVFDTISQSAARLCESEYSYVFRFDGQLIHLVAHVGSTGKSYEAMRRAWPREPNLGTAAGRAILNRRVVHVPDVQADPDYVLGPVAKAAAYRSTVAVPMLREGVPIGTINVSRSRAGAFTDRQIGLLQTFADQAVIAIENVRLFNETKESLERQTATAEILKVIASSPTDIQPVFDVIVERAVKLCGARFGRVYRYDGSLIHMVARHGLSTAGLKQVQSVFPRPAADDTIVGRVIVSRQPFFLEDIERDKTVPELSRQMIQALNTRSQVTIPMLRSGEPIGAMTLGWDQPEAFDDRQVALLQTFADQAVIAIENVRLFNETKEALDQQTATAGILRVISGSPTSVQPVFEAILEHALRLCDASFGYVCTSDGNAFDLSAQQGLEGDVLAAATKAFHETRVAGPQTALGRLRASKQMVHILDAKAERAYQARDPRRVAIVELAGARTMLAMPLLKEGDVIGAVVIYRREVRGFTEKQMTLLRTFADQAVIAIENVRLFNETKEALQRQTATADILKVIAGSPADVVPVFDAIGESAARLCDAVYSAVLPVENGMLHLGATYNWKGAGFEAAQRLFPMPLTADHLSAIAVRERRVIALDNLQVDLQVPATSRELAIATGYDSIVVVPMLREGIAQGALVVARRTPFAAHQVDLLQTFADQAVIAIENVRLFNETKEALEQQKASAEILGVISNSISDAGPVFDKITESCQKLFGSHHVGIRLVDDRGMLRFGAHRGPALEQLRAAPPTPLESTGSGLAIIERAVKHYPDVFGAADVPAGLKRACELTGARSIVCAPMLWEGRGIGAIYVARETVGPFSEKEIALLRTFADQAVIAIQNARLFNETKEALERQTATADILKVIAGSPSDVQPVFEAIVSSGARLFGRRAVLRLAEEGKLRRRALSDPVPGNQQGAEVMSIDRDNLAGRTFLEGRPLQVIDTLAPDAPLFAQLHAREWNFRSNAAAPLLREGKSIGIISVNSPEPGAMSDKQMEQLQTFADQAVIAIENVRLFNETKEALERQTATAEILKVIASSPSDVQPVFDAIAASARRLLDGGAALVNRRDGDMLELAAFTSTGEAGDAALKKLFPARLTGKGHMGKAILTGAPVLISDIEAEEGYSEAFKADARTRGFRSVVSVPMMKDGEPIGGISVNRPVAGNFTEHQTNLLKTFADQAVIAIENVRLFNETTEALERQTATSEVLNVIARSPSDVQPVLDAVAESAARLCGASDALIMTSEAGMLVRRAHFGPVQSVSAARPLTRGTPTGRAVLDRCTVHVEDVLAEIERGDYLEAAELQRRNGMRTILSVPLMREDSVIGVISMRRLEVRPFTEKQIALVKTFADQAVIAIENVRLFNETKESLERQTATAEILQVIGSSPTDTQPVFDAIVSSGVRLFPGAMITVARPDGRNVRAAAVAHQDTAMVAGWRERFTTPLTRDRLHAAAILDARLIDFPDAEAEKDGPLGPGVRNFLLSGNRAVTIMPMLRGEGAIGAISVTRRVPGPLSDKQIAILRTFADQAVIAIENVRLFNETKEALEQQTATSQVLGVISSSPTDVGPTYRVILDNVTRLCEANIAALFLYDGEFLRNAAHHNATPEFARQLDALHVKPSRETPTRLAALERRIVHVEDVLNDPSFSLSEGHRKEQPRAILSVPLMREGTLIGVITVWRREPRLFTEKQVGLVKTFADQAVIAIENVRLFNETTEALERQTATAEILKVIASSPSDVQPVFDAIVNSVSRLFGRKAGLRTVEPEGLRRRALSYEPSSDEFHGGDLEPLDATTNVGRAVLEGRALQRGDTLLDAENYGGLEKAKSLAFRSIASAPLMREGRAIGVISVSSPNPGALSGKQMELLSTFADQAVIAIENVRLFNETKEALERQTATAEVLKVISGSLTDTQPVFDIIAERAARLTGAAYAWVFTFDGALIHVASVIGLNGDAIEAARKLFPMRPSGRSYTARSIRDAQIVNVADALAETDPEYATKSIAAAGGYRSVLAVPMFRDRKVVGAISVNRSEAGRFGDKEVELLKTFADQAVIAIENVRLFKELETRTEALGNSVQKLTALSEVGQAIASTLELDRVLQTIAQHAVQLTGLDGASIYEYDEANEVFRVQAADNLAPAFLQAIRNTPIRKGDGTVGGVAITQEPVQVSDIVDDSYRSSRKDLLIRAGYRAILTVPLLHEDRIIGALSVTRKAPGPFAEEIVDLMKTFASQSAMAIQNARLFREIEEKGKQLEEASKHKSQFLASMSHELRTPLNAILGFNEMILGDVYGEVPGDMKEPLTDIQTSGKHLLRLINNVLDLAKIEAGRMELAVDDYSVHDTVESVRSTLRPLAEAKGLELAVDVPPDIPLARGDGGRITQCLMNLAGNSLKFTKQGSVGISVALANGTLTYKVQDTGIGIPADKIGSLFTEFKQTDATIASEYGGTGLGLSITKKFIEMHGGRIWAESEPGSGSTFIFEVPLRADEARGA